MFDAYFTACDIHRERLMADYGETINDAIDARYNLILDVEDKVWTDEEYEALVLTIEDETDDLPVNIDNINWYDAEEVVYTYHAALEVLDYCEHFYKTHEEMLAAL